MLRDTPATPVTRTIAYSAPVRTSLIVIEPIPDSCSSLQLFLLVHRLLLD